MIEVDRWTASAYYWEKHREVIRQMFAPVTEALVKDGRIEPGQAVLDIATGPGEPALSIAELVGNQGSVLGIDPIQPMVDAARREKDRRGASNVQFEVGLADHLPLGEGSFDAVVSRFGVMFFSNPLDCIREMLRVLKPSGRMALAVWHFEDRNPFFHTLKNLMAENLGEPAPQAEASNPFRFAEPGKLSTVLVEAGLDAVEERLLQFRIEPPVSAEEFVTLRFEMSEKFRALATTLSASQLSALRREAEQAVSPYRSGPGMSLPAEVLIVSGRKAPGTAPAIPQK
jgi:ubiquinone/menaquinone biosynthesis C-methylase UbiE